MSFKPTQSEVQAFMHEFQLCVFSSLGPKGQPQSATISFSENDSLELIVGTSTLSRKYANLKRDARMSMTVTDPERRYTLQYEGLAAELTQDQMNIYAPEHFRKLPGSLPFKDIPNQGYFLCKPVWVRFSYCSSSPWELTEFRF